MRHRLRRFWWRRSGAAKPVLLVILAVVLVVIPVCLASALRPRLLEYSEEEVKRAVTSAMNRAVQDNIAGLDTPLVSLTTQDGGSIAALTTDAATTDAIKTAVVQAVYDSIGALEETKLSVPIGTLIDPQYLAGKGFDIPFSVSGLGSVHAECTSEFSEAGINQTRHVLTLVVTAEVGIHTTGSTQNVTVTADYPLSDTVLVGNVPLVMAEN